MNSYLQEVQEEWLFTKKHLKYKATPEKFSKMELVEKALANILKWGIIYLIIKDRYMHSIQEKGDDYYEELFMFQTISLRVLWKSQVVQ